MFEHVSAYYLCENGSPVLVSQMGPLSKTVTLPLFKTRGAAVQQAAREGCSLAEATGEDLLKLLARSDIVDLGERRFPITLDGARLLGLQEISTPDDILGGLRESSR